MYIDFHFTPRPHHVDSFNQHEITRFNFVITLREFWNCFETFNYVCIAFFSKLLFIRKRRLKFLCNVFCNVIHLLISNNTYVYNICCVHCFMPIELINMNNIWWFFLIRSIWIHRIIAYRCNYIDNPTKHILFINGWKIQTNANIEIPMYAIDNIECIILFDSYLK